ncbi:MAG: carbohydrate ABC transporter permease [Ruminococcaceae bacterium]|nr:carbohydrate ABC transporter permease [Oscillospiraceae bacterium]
MNSAKNTPKVLKETKGKIQVDFDRTSKWTKFKIKYLSTRFLTQTIFKLFRTIILLGMCYIILNPFFSKIATSFMSPEDFMDVTVKYIPKHATLDTYKQLITENEYFRCVFNTGILSLACAFIQTFVCSLVGYGFAKYKFRGSGILFAMVMITLMVPPQTIEFSLFLMFNDFNPYGIFEMIGIAEESRRLLDTVWPFIILSLTGLGLKNGLYIFMMRQFYRGVPDELEESAYIDGSGPVKTFFKIILPISIPMMITIFLFSFSWQWTDNFYTQLFYTSNTSSHVLAYFAEVPNSMLKAIEDSGVDRVLYEQSVMHTCGLLIIAPLILIYLFCQRYLIQGIERSGITG